MIPTAPLASRVFVIACVACAALLGWAHTALAEEPLKPLAGLAPPDTGFYLELRNLDQVREHLRGLDVPRLFETFLAPQIARSDAPETAPAEWAKVLFASLGVPPAEAFEKLFSRQVALAAPEWERVSDGIIVVRLPAPDAVEVLVGHGRSVVRSSRGAKVTVYETNRGLWVAADKTFALLSHRGEESDFWRRALALLEGNSNDSLLGVRVYAGQERQLGPDCAGHLYFSLPSAAESRPAAEHPFSLWPICQRGLVGLYFRDRRLDLTFRGWLAHPRERTYRPRVSPDRLLRLPQTTLLTWETSVNLIEAHRRLVKSSSTELGAALVPLLAQGPPPDELEKTLFSQLGPRVVVVWGQVPNRPSSTPQLAVLVEASDAVAVAGSLAAAVDTILARFAGPQGSTTQPSRIVRTEHLGVGVYQIPLETIPAGASAGAPASSPTETLRQTLAPCFAPLDGWLAIALSPEHLEEIIDAERGVIPRLGDVPELGDVVRREQAAVSFVLAQPVLSSRLVNGWMAELSRGDDLLWRSILPDAVEAMRARRRVLGIGAQASERPGCVHVARVYPGGPADGRLLPGDEISAVDGRVLPVTDPNAELAQIIRGANDRTTVTLRVWRGQQALDVPIDLPRSAGAQGGGDAMTALERLVRIGESLNLAAFAEFPSRPGQYAARLTLSFRPLVGEPATQPIAPPTNR